MGLISRVSSRTYRDNLAMPRAKKKVTSNLGGALTNSRFPNKTKDRTGQRFRHKDKHVDEEHQEKFTQFQDVGVSITEQNDLQHFLDEAVLQNKDFETQRSKRINAILNANENDNSDEEMEDESDSEEHKPKKLTEEELQEIRDTLLVLPRRPEWTK